MQRGKSRGGAHPVPIGKACAALLNPSEGRFAKHKKKASAISAALKFRLYFFIFGELHSLAEVK